MNLELIHCPITDNNLNMLKDKDSKQSIQVTVRVRPLSQKELNDDPRTCVMYDQTHTLQLHGAAEVRKFTFDTICFNQSQEEIFERVGRKCTLDCLEGYNCTIFAYGQTGAGKTYTMMGVNVQHERFYQQRGLIPRTMQFLFQCIQEQREAGVNFIIHCSFLEIYNEQIIDLLNKSNSNMQLREDTRKGVYVEGLTEQMVSSSEEAMQVVTKGSKSRHVGSTFYNEASSRSHSVFTMQIESRHAKNGVINTRQRQFNFIDLAGSERTKQSTGERLKEGCNINKSLMNLATVINALSEVKQGKSHHINYRNSKLTFLLKDSLGGNSKTNLIANISPATSFYQETLSTLGFARRAKLIKRDKACINQDSSGNIESMKNEIKRLKQQIITLMSQSQSQSQQPSQTPHQMTTIMHEYVSEQIEKQTRLQMEILKLNDRIIKLQMGIKQYSNSDMHLRMIITVYEDKIIRLKEVENILAEKVELLAYGDEHTKTVIEYFKAQRNSLLKQIDALNKQACGSRFLRQLLKEAQIIKQEGEDNSIKDLLTKNTLFLASIHSKLNDIHDQNKIDVTDSAFEKKIVAIQRQFVKKEQQKCQRIEQLELELTQFKNRNDENQKLLEETVGVQIMLEQRVKQTEQQITRWMNQAQTAKDQVKSMEKETARTDDDQIVTELKQDLFCSKQQITLLKNQICTLQKRLEKSLLNQKILKQQFHELQEQKYRMDKMALQNIEGIKDQKHLVIKYESEIAIMQEKLSTLAKQQQETKNRVNEQMAEERRSNKNKIDSLQQRQKKAIQTYVDKQNSLIAELEDKNQRILNTEAELTRVTEQLNTLKMPFMLKEHEFESSMNSVDNSMELIELVKQKYADQDETAYQFDKIPELQSKFLQNDKILGLQSRFLESDCEQTKLKRSIDLKQVNKQKEAGTIIEADQTVRLSVKKNEAYQLKRQCLEMSETMGRLNSKIQALQEELDCVNQQIKQISGELSALQESDGQYKIDFMQVKNELVVAHKNHQIQLEALHAQLQLKHQQAEQLQKQLNKNKNKSAQQISELQEELGKTKKMLEDHAESIKQNIQNHLTAKDKKLTELKSIALDLQQQIKTISTEKYQALNKVEQITSDKSSLESQITQQDTKIAQLQSQLQQKLVDFEELRQTHSEQLEEQQFIHAQQIDHKNEQIETFMNDNEALNNELVSLKHRNSKLSKKAKQEIAQKQQSTDPTPDQQLASKECINHFQEELKFLRNQINEYQNESEQATDNIIVLANENQRIAMQYQLCIRNLTKQNQHLRLEKNQLQNGELEHKQEFVQYSKEINQLMKALEKEREAMHNKIIAQRQLQQQITLLEQQRNNQMDELNYLREAIQQQMDMANPTNIDDINNLGQQNQNLVNKNMTLQKTIEDLQSQIKSLYDKLSNYSQTMNSTASSLSSISVYKQKSQSQHYELQKMKQELENQQQEYSKLFNELCQERENQTNYKNFIENLQTQITQLQNELEQKDAVYKKLVQKIAKNEIENKKSTNPQQYQKTSDLLQKSRGEHLQLRRQNEQYKRRILQLQQELEEKDRYVKQVEDKSDAYCINMHKQIQEIQMDYVSLQNKQEKLVKQKRILEKQLYDNQMLRATIAKLSQRNQELQSRLKTLNFDYMQLENKINERKKSPLMSNSMDEKTVCINRLKAEVNALKNQKKLIVQSLSKERDEKNKLKSELKYEKDSGDLPLKSQLEKRINENNNLQELIFEVVSQLKISVLEPKTTLQIIRSSIMGNIKERNNQMRFLRQKVQQYERELQQRGFQVEQQQDRQLRSLNISNVKNMSHLEQSKSISKQKQGSSTKNSRQRTKQFQSYYARFRQSQETRNKN